MEIKYTKIKGNFVYPEIKKEAFRFGSRQITGVPLREDGDWRPYTPPEELQNVRGIESSACYVEAQKHTIATILEEQYKVIDQNFSSRFNALLSGGTEQGGSPIDGAQSIRHDGLIPDTTLSFSDDVTSWEDFHSFKGGSEDVCRSMGKEWLTQWTPQYDIVIEREYSIEEKYQKLREALKYSPVPISVIAWYEKDGLYVKPAFARDNHLVECVFLDEENHPYIWDTYAPFLKKLDKNYDFDFAMRWTITKGTLKKKENWLQEILLSLLEFFKDMF